MATAHKKPKALRILKEYVFDALEWTNTLGSSTGIQAIRQMYRAEEHNFSLNPYTVLLWPYAITITRLRRKD